MTKNPFLFMFFFSLLSCGFEKRNQCVSKKDAENQQALIYGIIEKIDTPKLNHGLLRIEIKNYNKEMIYHDQSFELDQAFYAEAGVQDSIIKHKGFLDMILVKNNGQKKMYKFNCAGLMHDSL